jgi:RNA polymerase sigma-70 factor (ECF subfamily)
LLDDARRGESEALSVLYREFSPGVFAYITLRVPYGMAEDLTSEVFLKMVESIHHLRTSDEIGFIGWLLQIARISIANYYRQRKKQPMYVRFEPALLRKEDTSETWMIPANHPDTDPVLWTEAREEWDRVVKAINMLTEEQRQVLVGRLLLGYHVKTVARTIGKNANAVKALQFRALRSLKRLLLYTKPV